MSPLALGMLVCVVAADPAPPPYPPTELPGTLVLAGGGKLPDAVREAFVTLAGGKGTKLVVIPTASVTTDEPADPDTFRKPWADLGVTTVTVLHTVDRKRADDPQFVRPLTEANAVWLTGGKQSRLLEAYGGTAVEKELKAVLARGGVVGGTSAGAMAVSAPMIEGGQPEARTARGFGLLPGVAVD